MTYCNVFKRFELKYLLTYEQYRRMKTVMSDHMRGDKYGESDILNVYYDTPDYLLIRRSLEKPLYKEKLRLRSYGVATENSKTFPELKKKFESVVYKRRLSLPEGRAMACFAGRESFPDTQIGRELAFCIERYGGLEPKVFLSYEREAFYAKSDHDFRMTFDQNILWRNTELSLQIPAGGYPLLGAEETLLEVKTAGALPHWLVEFLSANKLYKTSFSKYGGAYRELLTGRTQQGGYYCA